MRLDLRLIRQNPAMSRRKARDVIEKGQVSVDGAAVREPGREVDEGAAVVFDPNRRALSRVRCELPVLHEDEHVIVVDKPAGLLTVPSAPGVHDEDTALARVQEYARRLKPRGGTPSACTASTGTPPGRSRSLSRARRGRGSSRPSATTGSSGSISPSWRASRWRRAGRWTLRCARRG